MRFFVGTSGYGYKEWRGKFYPPKMPPEDMLGYYARQFPAVEINQTFRRMPEARALKAWARQVPAGFRFVLKAPQAITHIKRLYGVKKQTNELLRAASALDRRQGPLFFQLPPNFKKDVSRLSTFLDTLGKGARAAFEFRHESWFDDEVYDCLRSHSCALCAADAKDLPAARLVRTTNWGYIRLRRERYDDRSLRRWIAKIMEQKWREAFVFFRHEETGTGPRFATRFLELAER